MLNFYFWKHLWSCRKQKWKIRIVHPNGYINARLRLNGTFQYYENSLKQHYIEKGDNIKKKRSKFQKLQSQISTINILDSSRSSFLSYGRQNKKIFDVDSRGEVKPVDSGFENIGDITSSFC